MKSILCKKNNTRLNNVPECIHYFKVNDFFINKKGTRLISSSFNV